MANVSSIDKQDLLFVEEIKEASYPEIATEARSWGEYASEKFTRLFSSVCQLPKAKLDGQISRSYINWMEYAMISQSMSENLQKFPSQRNFDCIYVCRDVALRRIQGIMATRKESIELSNGRQGDFFVIVYLVSNPQNSTALGNAEKPRVRGSGTALISYIANECLHQRCSGLYLMPTYTSGQFYLNRGFEFCAHSQIQKDDQKHMMLTAQKIEECFCLGKLSHPLAPILHKLKLS